VSIAADKITVTNLASLEEAIEDLQLAFNDKAICWRGHAGENWELEPGTSSPKIG
jgi:hypothetical protein